MGLLIYPLIQGREAGWPAWTYLMVVGERGLVRRAGRRGPSGCVGAAATRWSRRASSAIAPTPPGLSMIVVFFAGMIGTMLVLTLFMQFGDALLRDPRRRLTLAPFAAGTAIGADARPAPCSFRGSDAPRCRSRP